MDAQLALLHEIKTAVWILIYLVGAGVLINLFRAVAASYGTIKSELANAFSNTASAMYESGKYEELTKLCHEHLKEKPRDAYAFWFLGKTHFELKEYDKAVEYFNKAGEIYPSWEKEWIGPFLETIEAERKSPLTIRSA